MWKWLGITISECRIHSFVYYTISVLLLHRLVWKHSTHEILARYMSIYFVKRCVSKLKSILSITFYEIYGDVFFRLPIFLLMIVRIVELHTIIIIISVMWIITDFSSWALKQCTGCLSMFYKHISWVCVRHTSQDNGRSSCSNKCGEIHCTKFKSNWWHLIS